jgi:hypothetical protein
MTTQHQSGASAPGDVAMKKIVHPISGALALLTITTFWLATVASEIWGSTAMIVAVKSAIPWGFLVLVPCLALAGGTGVSLSKGARAGLAGRKLRRMPFIAANGLLVLIPSALVLAMWARAGRFDTGFYLVQALELIAGAINITLLTRNMRDGLRMTGRLRKS